MSDDDVLTFASAEVFAAWLEANHRTVPQVWVALAKKGTDVPSITRSEALDIALCYGWIDGKATSATTPDGWWAQRFTPRRPRSTWSKVNCAKVEELIRTGRMRPAGLEQVEAAKADGRWAAAYDSPRTAEVPDDLRAALDADPSAAEAFAALNKSSRFEILLNLQTAKRPETRARRIQQHVARLGTGEAPTSDARKPQKAPIVEGHR